VERRDVFWSASSVASRNDILRARLPDWVARFVAAGIPTTSSQQILRDAIPGKPWGKHKKRSPKIWTFYIMDDMPSAFRMGGDSLSKFLVGLVA
jgi:hypothetical protein